MILGGELYRAVREAYGEDNYSAWADVLTIFTYCYDAAMDINQRLQILKSSTTISTVASTREYNLPYDFQQLYLKNDDEDYVIRINDGTSDYDITEREYEAVWVENDTNTVAIPDSFSVKLASSQPSAISITSNASGAVDANFESLCSTATASAFASANVGDSVLILGKPGRVTYKTSNTSLQVAMEDGYGVPNTTTVVIIPVSLWALYFSPIPSTSSYTITVPYLKKPDGVFSYNRSYNLDQALQPALVAYCVSKLKERDRATSDAAYFMQQYEAVVRSQGSKYRSKKLTKGYRVNMKKDFRDYRSWR